MTKEKQDKLIEDDLIGCRQLINEIKQFVIDIEDKSDKEIDEFREKLRAKITETEHLHREMSID